MLFGARGQSRLAFDDERAELVAVDFRKDDEDIGKTAVRDPHLLAVEDVFLAVFTQTRRCLRCHRVRTRARFRQRVRSDQLARRDLRQVLAFRCVGGEVDDRQKTDATFRAKRRSKGSAAPDVFTNERAARLVQSETAVLFGDVGADQSEFSRFGDELARQFPIVLLELVDVWCDFVIGKLPRRVGNHAMLFGEVFGREDLLRLSLLDQKRPTFDYLFLFGYG